MNIINDTGIKANSQTKNKNNNIKINSPYKTFNKETFSKIPIIKNIPKKQNEFSEFNHSEIKQKLRLIEMPEINLSSISSSMLIPLNNLDKNKKVYKNMYHIRTLDFSLFDVRKQLSKIYGMPALLVEQNSFEDDHDMNSLLLNNKIRIIKDNIEHFKMNIMHRKEFLEAFNNMENYQKAELNYNLEEISCILIQTIPVLMQNYYETLITIVIPNIKQERLKKPESETQCLNLNYAFFNSAIEYFNICLEVYHILNLKENRFIYTITDFGILNSYLDLIRYLTNNLNSMSDAFIAFINKTKNDKKILDRMEIVLNLKKPIRKKIDILERFHKRHRKQASEWELKIERVNRALNMDSISKSLENKDKKSNWRKFKIKEKNSFIQKSAFNSDVFRSMLKYFKPEIKSKIIALQIVDRFEMKKNEAMNLQEEGDNESGNTRKVFV